MSSRELQLLLQAREHEVRVLMEKVVDLERVTRQVPPAPSDATQRQQQAELEECKENLADQRTGALTAMGKLRKDLQAQFDPQLAACTDARIEAEAELESTLEDYNQMMKASLGSVTEQDIKEQGALNAIQKLQGRLRKCEEAHARRSKEAKQIAQELADQARAQQQVPVEGWVTWTIKKIRGNSLLKGALSVALVYSVITAAGIEVDPRVIRSQLAQMLSRSGSLERRGMPFS